MAGPLAYANMVKKIGITFVFHLSWLFRRPKRSKDSAHAKGVGGKSRVYFGKSQVFKW